MEIMREGTILIAFLHPAAPTNRKMFRLLQERSITSFTMGGIPRISRVQCMDAMTSMSTVAGYKSVLIAANIFPKLIPLVGTAIGTIKAAKFLMVGAGVVGLQAIATTKRLVWMRTMGREVVGRVYNPAFAMSACRFNCRVTTRPTRLLGFYPLYSVKNQNGIHFSPASC